MDSLDKILDNKEQYLELSITYGSKVIGFIAIIWGALIISKMLQKAASKGLNKSNVDETLSLALGNLIKWIVLVAAIVTALGVFGIPTASFAAILAAAGFAIGMALQGSLSNFASGVLILIFRPFKVGDFVTVASQSGTIKIVDLFTTAIDTTDNRRIIVPNSNIFGNIIENVTFHEFRRVDVSVGVSYEADIDTTRSVLKNSAAKVKNLLKDKESVIVLTNLGGSSVDWQVRVFCKTGDYWGVKEELTETIKKDLDAANISIPYPHMEVIVKK